MKNKHGETYQKRPVLVHAIQFNSVADIPKIKEWVESFGDDYYALFKGGKFFGVRTLEDEKYNFHAIRETDFIVRGIDGEYYPCFAPIFHKLHEKVEE